MRCSEPLRASWHPLPPPPFPLVPKLHFGTDLSGQFHCRRVAGRAGRGDGIAKTRAFRDGVAERVSTLWNCRFTRFGFGSFIVFIFSNPFPIHVHHIGAGSGVCEREGNERETRGKPNQAAMNKSHALSIALVAIASFPSISDAGDIFDSPGPGYRQQIERLFPPIDLTRSFPIRVESASLLSPSSLSPAPDFSEPIRLFMRPQQTSTSPLAPTQATPTKPK